MALDQRMKSLHGVLLLMCVSPTFAQPSPQLTPLAVDVLAAPQAVRGSDGAKHLVYEVRIANLTDKRFSLKQIEVLDERGATLRQRNAQTIGTRLSLGGRRGSESNALEGYQFGVAFLHVIIPDGTPVPASLTHAVAGYSERIGSDIS